jgi:hypothetical protein
VIGKENDMNGKEIAKFFSGVAANQVVTHAGLSLAGIEFDLWGIAYTQGLNAIAAALWAVAFAVLVYFAWLRK